MLEVPQVIFFFKVKLFMKNTGSSETLYKPRQLHAVYKMTVCLNTTLDLQ